MPLHCSPPANVLEHGLAVTGLGPHPMLAIIDAVVKLMADMPFVTAALERDAKNAQCPEDCPKKTVGKVGYRGVSFFVGFDGKKNQWHCTIGIAGSIEIECEPKVEG